MVQTAPPATFLAGIASAAEDLETIREPVADQPVVRFPAGVYAYHGPVLPAVPGNVIDCEVAGSATAGTFLTVVIEYGSPEPDAVPGPHVPGNFPVLLGVLLPPTAGSLAVTGAAARTEPGPPAGIPGKLRRRLGLPAFGAGFHSRAARRVHRLLGSECSPAGDNAHQVLGFEDAEDAQDCDPGRPVVLRELDDGR